MKYTYILYYPDGESDTAEESFNTEKEAIDAALQACYDFQVGGEIMGMMGDRDEDIIEGDCDFDIIEIDDE